MSETLSKSLGDTLLQVRDLKMHFPIKEAAGLGRTKKVVQAVDGVNFELKAGASLGLVGESGCGKSTTGRMITRLLTPTSGEIVFKGTDIAQLKERDLRPFRRQLQIVFQDPYSSLNPRQTVSNIISTPLRVHNLVKRGKELERVQELLERVGLNPEHHNRYPNEFSGGQRQRIGIARALAVEPEVIIADEPVSALDVSIQAQVMNLLEDLRRDLGIAFVFIAHDLGPGHHPGRAAEGADPAGRRRTFADRPTERLPVPDPLLEGRGHLRHPGAAAGDQAAVGSGPHGRLPLRGAEGRPDRRNGLRHE
jgi:peptide/nickel transport system ATP-binding protein/oligopeptide transport system ATP-binding protein